MGREILLYLLVVTAISKDIFEPADLDKIFKSEGKDNASEKKNELQKSKSESKDASKDKQYIGFQYSNESTTTCFINPQTSEKKVQKEQLSYVVSLSSLLSKASSAPTSTHTQTSSAPALNAGGSVLSSAEPASALGNASLAKSTTSASTYKTKERSEKTKTSSRASSVLSSVTSKDEKKPISAHILSASGKHREEVPAAIQKEKQEKKEPGKGKYWTTVMAYGSPEKVLIGVKTITIIESIIQEPAISSAAFSIVRTAQGEKEDVRSSETMKVGDIVMPPQGTSGPQRQDVGNIAKSASEARGKSSRPEIAAEMPTQAKKGKSAATGVDEQTPRTTSGVMSQSSSFSTKHTASAGEDGAIEKLTIAIPVQKGTGHGGVVSIMSKSALLASQITKENKQSKKGDGVETKTEQSTRNSKEENATASKVLASVFSSAPASSDTSSESSSSSSETAFTGKEKNQSTIPKSSITVVMVKHPKTRSSSPAVLSSATSGMKMSSIQHSLSQIIEKVQKSLSSSLATVTSTKKELEKAAAPVSASSARFSVPTSVLAFSKQASEIESRTQKHAGAKRKTSQPSTATSTTTKKHKEGFGGLGIWKRIGDFSNDGEESSKDTAERNAHVSKSAVKNVGKKKESGVEHNRKSDSIVDILTVLNDVSKKKGDNTKVFIDGDFQAKKNDKKIGSKLKFKGWISNSTNE